jgi:cytochrome c oxidase subunit II
MSTSAVEVNGALIYILAISLLMFFLIVFFMVYFLVRYRRSRNPVPEELHGNVLLESIWVIIPTLILLTMFYYGLTGFTYLRNSPSNSMIVKVHARQWSWLFEYENGTKSPDLIVPINKNIKCELSSDDVIHGFYVPAFRIQQDTLPGIKTEAWFNASVPGIYDIFCSQYCGLKHSQMLAKLIVVSREQFDTWIAGGKINLAGSAQTSGMPPGYNLLRERGCISCHSMEGVTMTGPPLNGLYGKNVTVVTAGVSRVIIADDTYLKKHIIDPGADVVEGFPNIMPSGRGILSDAEVGDIIIYLKTLK